MKFIAFSFVALLVFIALGNLGAVESEKSDTILVTLVLKHNQELSLGEIQSKMKKTGFWKNFPPDGVEVESWKIAMGLGQIVTLRLPPSKVRELNLSIERGAWSGFFTEIYLTYDFEEIWKKEYSKK